MKKAPSSNAYPKPGDTVKVIAMGIRFGKVGRVLGYGVGFEPSPVPMGKVTENTLFVVEFQPGDAGRYTAPQLEVLDMPDPFEYDRDQLLEKVTDAARTLRKFQRSGIKTDESRAAEVELDRLLQAADKQGSLALGIEED